MRNIYHFFQFLGFYLLLLGSMFPICFVFGFGLIIGGAIGYRKELKKAGIVGARKDTKKTVILFFGIILFAILWLNREFPVIDEAKTIALLEKHKSIYGRYPSTLTEIGLYGGTFYSMKYQRDVDLKYFFDGKDFELNYSEDVCFGPVPGCFYGASYSSKTRDWN